MSNPIFATTGCPSTTNSESYRFISTMNMVRALNAAGWIATKTNIANTRRRSFIDENGTPYLRPSLKDGYQRHRIVFERLADGSLPEVGGAKAQILMTNDHSGGGAFTLSIGMYRYVCANGLAIPAGVVAKARFMHKSRFTPDEFRELVANEVLRLESEFSTVVLPTVKRMEEITLTPERSADFALDAAVALGLNPTNVADLLVARNDGENDSLWSVFNRVQEASIKGGISQIGRARRTRSVTAMKREQKINETLFNLALDYAKVA